MIRCTKHPRDVQMIETMPYIHFTVESLQIVNQQIPASKTNGSTFLARTPSTSCLVRMRNNLITTRVYRCILRHGSDHSTDTRTLLIFPSSKRCSQSAQWISAKPPSAKAFIDKVLIWWVRSITPLTDDPGESGRLSLRTTAESGPRLGMNIEAGGIGGSVIDNVGGETAWRACNAKGEGPWVRDASCGSAVLRYVLVGESYEPGSSVIDGDDAENESFGSTWECLPPAPMAAVYTACTNPKAGATKTCCGILFYAKMHQRGACSDSNFGELREICGSPQIRYCHLLWK